MPLQNRVTPEGEIIANPARGLMMGNRGGRLHDETRTLGRRRWASKQWIACRLDFRGRQRKVMGPRGYTELFFVDEATALAAGHRPCFECRRQDALSFARALNEPHGGQCITASEIDSILHAERLTADGAKRTYCARLHTLPDSAIVRSRGASWLLRGAWLLRWTPAGYRDPRPITPDLEVDVLTPLSIIKALKSGYTPLLHETARVSR
jgi:hypothetical protein